MAENTREIVLDILLSLERGEQQYSNRLLKAVLDKYDYLDSRDKSFIKRVTEGTVERRLELDYYLNHYSSVPVKKMKPLMRCLLRMSVYQLCYMDAVPDSAVCNEACKLAVKRKFGNLKGFVNGVLRNISREKDRLPLPDAERESTLRLSVEYSMPEWLVQRWLEEYGKEITVKLLQGLLAIHPVSLRFRTDLSEQERESLVGEMEKKGAALRPSSYLPYLYILEYGDSLTGLPGFQEGKWTVQDVSSALAVEAAGISAGDFVIDACAAPGGKSILAAERAKKVLSRDVSEEKTALIAENAERMRAENIEIQVWDATVPDEANEKKADVVLLDVPCSGLGILGKKRDIKYHVSPEGLESLTSLQREIVGTCAAYVRPGGTLVYSTCTIDRAENEEMVRFLTEEMGFQPSPLTGLLPEELLSQKQEISERRKKAAKEGFALTEAEQDACIQLLPGYMEADGFFIARFVRPTE